MSEVAYAAEKRRFISITRQFSNWTEQVLGTTFQKYYSEQTWIPSANLCEHDSYYCLIVELAGMSAEQIDLRVEGEKRVLVLSGDRPAPKPPERDDIVCLHLMEIDHGRFSRALELPEDVDADGIEAKYRSGYLWVKLPKKQDQRGI
ncbi:MAG: Hsp20/alpha crystallin family protein [Planctomycetota bacterium]|jgi:HSP20 family protein